MRYTPFLPGSAGLSQFELCPGSACFRGPPGPTSNAMWYGIYVHRFLEYAVNRGHKSARDWLNTQCGSTSARSVCSRIDLTMLPRLATAEVPLLYDPFSRLTRRRHYKAGNPNIEWYGRADFIAEGSCVHLVDWKSGSGDPTPPMESDQLLGMAVALHYEGNKRVKISHGQVQSDGSIRFASAVLEQPALVALGDRLAKVRLRIIVDRQGWELGRAVPDFVPGPHCQWCDLKPECPGHGHPFNLTP